MKKILLSLFVSLSCFGATFTSVTNRGQAYLTTDILNEIYTSMLYRTSSPLSDPSLSVIYSSVEASVGDPIGSSKTGEFFSGYRNTLRVGRRFVGNEYSKWLVTAPTGNVESISSYTNMLDFFVDAGLSSNGWRVAYEYNTASNDWTDLDDPMYVHSASENTDLFNGEILGPWIIDDLQKALGSMNYYIDRTPTWNSKGETNLWLGSGIDPSWSTAKTEAETDFSELDNNSGYPFMESRGSINVLGGNYSVTIRSRSAYLKLSAPSLGSAIYNFGGEFLSYAFAEKQLPRTEGDYTFSGNGFSYVVETNYSSFASTNIASGNTNIVYSTKYVDETQIPDWVDEPPFTGTNYYKGFYVTDEIILIKPDFPYTL